MANSTVLAVPALLGTGYFRAIFGYRQDIARTIFHAAAAKTTNCVSALAEAPYMEASINRHQEPILITDAGVIVNNVL